MKENCPYVVYSELRTLRRLAMMISLKKITGVFFQILEVKPNISDLMKIGGACHPVISECPFNCITLPTIRKSHIVHPGCWERTQWCVGVGGLTKIGFRTTTDTTFIIDYRILY